MFVQRFNLNVVIVFPTLLFCHFKFFILQTCRSTKFYFHYYPGWGWIKCWKGNMTKAGDSLKAFKCTFTSNNEISRKSVVSWEGMTDDIWAGNNSICLSSEVEEKHEAVKKQRLCPLLFRPKETQKNIEKRRKERKKHNEYEKNFLESDPQTQICACEAKLLCSPLISPFLFYSHFILSEPPFILLDVFQPFYTAVLVAEWQHVCACVCRCVLMQRVAVNSLMYLYFSPSLQASLLLHQCSIFQIKWSWLKDCANVWFLKCVRVSTGTLGAISDVHYCFMSFDYGHS